jgi:hypothetical protein
MGCPDRSPVQSDHLDHPGKQRLNRKWARTAPAEAPIVRQDGTGGARRAGIPSPWQTCTSPAGC